MDVHAVAVVVGATVAPAGTVVASVGGTADDAADEGAGAGVDMTAGGVTESTTDGVMDPMEESVMEGAMDMPVETSVNTTGDEAVDESGDETVDGTEGKVVSWTAGRALFTGDADRDRGAEEEKTGDLSTPRWGVAHAIFVKAPSSSRGSRNGVDEAPPRLEGETCPVYAAG